MGHWKKRPQLVGAIARIGARIAKLHSCTSETDAFMMNKVAIIG